MELLISNKDKLKCGFFLLNKKEVAAKKFDGQDLLFLTQDGQRTLKSQILDLIAKSTKYIKICSFILTDADVMEALLDRAKELSLPIFIITQLDSQKLKDHNFLTEEELNNNSTQQHLNYIRKLYNKGVHIRASYSAHAKFIIADGMKCLITSANLTSPSLTYNNESGFFTDQGTLVQLESLFDAIYQTGTIYRQFYAGTKGKQLISQSKLSLKKEWLPEVFSSNLRYTYENKEHCLLKEIVKILHDAKEYVFISTYSIVSLDGLPGFIKEVKNAIERGVNINIFCRGMNYREIDHIAACNHLSDLGCKLFGDVFNHSKGIISETTGMLFTANIDGKHGLTNGFEVGLVLNDTQRQIFLGFHKYLIENAIYYFAQDPSREDFMVTYSHYESRKSFKNKSFSNITIYANVIDEREMDKLKAYPLYWGSYQDKSSNKEIPCLFVHDLTFPIKVEKDVFEIVEKHKKIPSQFIRDKRILIYKILKINT